MREHVDGRRIEANGDARGSGASWQTLVVAREDVERVVQANRGVAATSSHIVTCSP